MTKLLDSAIEQARRLPAERQNEVAEILLTVVAQDEPEAPRLGEEQTVEVRRRQANRTYASD
ncbi:MAG TPA: hypothetical protein QGF63_08650 [Alphaproteobacteria bacterium]|jgi:hypothetical protein|nr:hypothetical protein [Alphaproteobacteria bacterium]HJM49907.1 hypothetical protein [Alphaproteobacteria bacterium]|tara:strand:- start:135 stop:320 length:186 start_codon:yes stop_codon:yes gene_type:complete